MRQEENWGRAVTTISQSATADLKAEFGNRDDRAGRRWIEMADSMSAGEYGPLITLLVEQNKSVMHSRGGAAWIEEEKGTLKVRVSEERGHLPRQEDLPDLWRFPYFLNSFCSVAAPLKEGRRGMP
jgi:hypothetical protein